MRKALIIIISLKYIALSNKIIIKIISFIYIKINPYKNNIYRLRIIKK
jgi:hypothetical protein